jgi:two-component sensor histidine kinase
LATSTDAVPMLRLSWREHGGPPVRAPRRDGFGRRLVEQAVPYELKARVRLGFEPGGVTCELEAPLSTLTSPG